MKHDLVENAKLLSETSSFIMDNAVDCPEIFNLCSVIKITIDGLLEEIAFKDRCYFDLTARAAKTATSLGRAERELRCWRMMHGDDQNTVNWMICAMEDERNHENQNT